MHQMKVDIENGLLPFLTVDDVFVPNLLKHGCEESESQRTWTLCNPKWWLGPSKAKLISFPQTIVPSQSQVQ